MKHEPIHQSVSSECIGTDSTPASSSLKIGGSGCKKVAKKWGKLFRNRTSFRFRKNEEQCYGVESTCIDSESLGEQELIFQFPQVLY